MFVIPLSPPGSGSNRSPLMRLREAVEITAPDGELMAYSAAPVWRMCKPEPLAWLCLQDTLTDLADRIGSSFRPRFLEWGLMTANDLDTLLLECQRIAHDPEVFLTSFIVMQVWGRKPKNITHLSEDGELSTYPKIRE